MHFMCHAGSAAGGIREAVGGAELHGAACGTVPRGARTKSSARPQNSAHDGHRRQPGSFDLSYWHFIDTVGFGIKTVVTSFAHI